MRMASGRRGCEVVSPPCPSPSPRGLACLHSSLLALHFSLFAMCSLRFVRVPRSELCLLLGYLFLGCSFLVLVVPALVVPALVVPRLHWSFSALVLRRRLLLPVFSARSTLCALVFLGSLHPHPPLASGAVVRSFVRLRAAPVFAFASTNRARKVQGLESLQREARDLRQ